MCIIVYYFTSKWGNGNGNGNGVSGLLPYIISYILQLRIHLRRNTMKFLRRMFSFVSNSNSFPFRLLSLQLRPLQ